MSGNRDGFLSYSAMLDSRRYTHILYAQETKHWRAVIGGRDWMMLCWLCFRKSRKNTAESFRALGAVVSSVQIGHGLARIAFLAVK